MGKFTKRSCQQMLASKYYEHSDKLNEANNFDQQNCWKLFTKKDGETKCDDHTISYDSSNSFPLSSSSSSSSDLIEDASSSSSSSSMSNGPLFKLSDLMAQLPVKRGLSKYYEGKSQSYATLASVVSLEDLAKREHPCCNKRIKYCNSFCEGLELDLHRPHTLFCTSSEEINTIINKNQSSHPEALFFFQNNGKIC